MGQYLMILVLYCMVMVVAMVMMVLNTYGAHPPRGIGQELFENYVLFWNVLIVRW